MVRMVFSHTTRLRAQQDRALVTYLATLMQTVELELAQFSQHERWINQVPFLIQLTEST